MMLLYKLKYYIRTSLNNGLLKLLTGGADRVCWIDDETEAAAFRNSGDLVERDGCGGIVYRGRRDEQIKRNGKRVNLQELEQVCHGSLVPLNGLN